MKLGVFTFCFLLLGILTYGQKPELSGFEGIDFGTTEYNLKNQIAILTQIYGFKEESTTYEKKYPDVKRIMISSEGEAYKNFKFYFTAPNVNDKRIFVAAADVYKVKSKSNVCVEFNRIYKELKEKYTWEEVTGGYSGDCCGCEKSLSSYRPKEVNYNPYAMYYRKIFRSDSKNRIYLDAYESKSGQWFVRAFYFVDGFNEIFRKVYSI